MTATDISVDQDFYAPSFEITVDGKKLADSVAFDILDVTFEDSLDSLEYFEFTLNDWDQPRSVPKYSSPYDDKGDKRWEAFDPGRTVELGMGYIGSEQLVKKMAGRIVSITPSFPAAGMPTMRVRVLSDLFALQHQQMTKPYPKTKDTTVARELADEIGIPLATRPGQERNEIEYEFLMLNNEFPVNYLMRRARTIGYDLQILPKITPEQNMDPQSGDGPFLFFGPADEPQATYALAWGRTLSSFDLTVRVKDQVGKVIVKGVNPANGGARRDIEGIAQLADIDLALPDRKLLEAINSALGIDGSDRPITTETVVTQPVQNQAEADIVALGILRQRAKELITAQGSTVGFPDLRAGGAVEITGIGSRYSGRWRLTKTTHTIDSSGYTTNFSARLEGKLP